MRTIKKLINTEKKVYILLKNKAIQYRFMSVNTAARAALARSFSRTITE